MLRKYSKLSQILSFIPKFSTITNCDVYNVISSIIIIIIIIIIIN